LHFWQEIYDCFFRELLYINFIKIDRYKAKIPIDLATLRDFLFYLLFHLSISFPIVFYKYTLVFVLKQDIY